MSRFDTSSIEQNNNTIVSIIIPSYNAELYIGACLDSLIHQTYSALEIICVDDGSTDNTYHILETYHSMDNRIKLLKQNHQTAGAARNCGISEYSRAVTPQVRQAGNRLSGLTETTCASLLA